MDYKPLKMDWNLGQQDLYRTYSQQKGNQDIQQPGHTYNKIQDLKQPDTGKTDSVQIMKAPKKVTLK